MEQFKKAIFAALRLALRKAQEQDANRGQSTLGKFLMGQTDELTAPPVAASDQFVVELALRFSEILRSVQVLSDIVQYLKRFPPGSSRSRYLNYHVRSYLQEMYILRERLNALLTKYERWNAPIAQNVEMGNTLRNSRDLIKDMFDPIVAVRDNDVHHRQFSDPELDRLEGWEGLIEGGVDPGKEWMQQGYENQITAAREKWIAQIETNNSRTSRVIDAILDVLFEITFGSDGQLIIPKSYRPARGRG